MRLVNCHTSLIYQFKSDLYAIYIDLILILRYYISIKEAEYGRIKIKKPQQNSC